MRKSIEIARRQMLLTGLQADIISKQHEVGRLDFIAEHRPWVCAKVRIGSRGLYKRDYSLYLCLLFCMKNTGRTPALCAWPEFMAEPQVKDRNAALAAQVARAHEWVPRGDGTGYPVFPEDEVTQEITYALGKIDEIEKTARLNG